MEIRTGRLIAAAATVVLTLFLMHACGNRDTGQIPVTQVAKGVFYIDLFEEGEIEAIRSVTIPSPTISWRYGNLKISQIVKDGQDVKAGDTLIMFDPSEVYKGIVEAESRLEISKAELEKMVAQHQSELEELKADYEVSRIAHEISQIRFEQAEYESEIKKKEIQINLEKAGISLEQAREQINNRTKIQKEEVKQKNLSIEQDRKQLQEAHETLQKMCVTTSTPGIAIISQNWSTGNKFQVGDQCWSGFPLIQLPDLTTLKAKVNINEVDISKIQKGLAVEVRPDAFSEKLFTGSVMSVANLAVNKEDTKIKVFPVEVLLNETDENLLPGLTVSCRLIIDKLEDVLYLPIEAVYTEEDKSFVFRKRGSDYEKTYVETGAVNSDYIVITSGLDEKDTVALTDPTVKPEEEEKPQTEDSAS